MLDIPFHGTAGWVRYTHPGLKGRCSNYLKRSRALPRAFTPTTRASAGRGPLAP